MSGSEIINNNFNYTGLKYAFEPPWGLNFIYMYDILVLPYGLFSPIQIHKRN